MRILFLGDIVGRPGRVALKGLLPGLRREHACDLVVANVENAAAGFGLTESVGREILASGVDVMTGGNHLFDRRGSESYLNAEARLVRPANFAPGTPGRRIVVAEVGGRRIGVLNLQGRVFMPPADCPFRSLDALLEEFAEAADLFVLDLHAEATSEKLAMGVYADGRLSAVVGTHTHVATADETVLPRGTAYVSDLGMTGPRDSVLGMDRGLAVRRFLESTPVRLEVASKEPALSGLLVEIDEASPRAVAVERIHASLSEGVRS